MKRSGLVLAVLGVLSLLPAQVRLEEREAFCYVDYFGMTIGYPAGRVELLTGAVGTGSRYKGSPGIAVGLSLLDAAVMKDLGGSWGLLPLHLRLALPIEDSRLDVRGAERFPKVLHLFATGCLLGLGSSFGGDDFSDLGARWFGVGTGLDLLLGDWRRLPAPVYAGPEVGYLYYVDGETGRKQGSFYAGARFGLSSWGFTRVRCCAW
jgi:hypothetical protein